MVNTIKFSQMTNAGNINNNDIMPSLRTGSNVILNNPWTFLPPGDTASRPLPSATINYRLRFNTDDQLYEYYDAILGAWTQLQENTFTVGPFITYTADSSLPGAQNLGALANGILKQTITTGVATLNIAVNGADYYGPGFVVRPADGGTGVNNNTLTINLGNATTGDVLTSDSSGNATWQSISASGAITTINGDSGSAIPLSGVITISGASTGLTLTGASHTVSLGGVLNPTYGGSGINNGSNTLTLGGNLMTAGAFASTFTMTNVTNVTFPTSGTLATISQLPTPSALTKSDDVNVTLTLGGTPAVSLLQAVSLTLGWTGQLSVARGGSGLAAITAHNLLIGNGTSSLTLLAPSATSGIPLISQGSSSDPAYGTAVVAGGGTGNTTFTAYSVICAGTTAAGVFQNVVGVGNAGEQLTSNGPGALPTWQPASSSGTVNSGLQNQLAYYAANGTAVSALATANNGTLVTDGTGIPSISSTLPTTVQSNITQLGAQVSALNMNTHLINNVVDPVSAQDAATKNYVDSNATTFPISLAHGGTNANLTASNGGIFYSTASTGAILAGTATARQMLQSGPSTTPTWSTATWPATIPINQVLYSSTANTITGLATVNSSVFVTSSGGVPSLSTTLPASLVIPTPKIGTSLLDSNGNTMTQFNPQAGTIANWLAFSNNITGTGPGIGVDGTDTNRSLVLTGKGTGGVQIAGIRDGTVAAINTIGETFSSTVLSASAISLSTTVIADVTSISPGPGNFTITANVTFLGSTTNIGVAQCWINTTSATKPDIALVNGFTQTVASFSYFGTQTVSFTSDSASSLTFYLSCQSNFGTGTVTACGSITATRNR